MGTKKAGYPYIGHPAVKKIRLFLYQAELFPSFNLPLRSLFEDKAFPLSNRVVITFVFTLYLLQAIYQQPAPRWHYRLRISIRKIAFGDILKTRQSLTLEYIVVLYSVVQSLAQSAPRWHQPKS
jgi:hypothetical protein